MRPKVKIFTAPEIRIQGLIYFGDDQFKKLKRKQLNIPIKLFKM